MVSLDHNEVACSKWTFPGSSEWEQQLIVDLYFNRELEINIFSRNMEDEALCGLVYMRLEDFIYANATTLCLPLDPQGFLLVEATYRVPTTKPKQLKVNMQH